MKLLAEYLEELSDVLDEPFRAGLPWPPEEDELLAEYFGKGLSISDLAWVHSRSHGAIRSRLSRLDLIYVDKVDRMYRRRDGSPCYCYGCGRDM